MATPAPAREPKPSKEEKLKELAAKRVPAAIDKIRRIGNLGSYKPTAQATLSEKSNKVAYGTSAASLTARIARDHLA